MKRLTMDQMRSIGVFNQYYFAGRDGWYVSYDSDTRRGGWRVFHPKIKGQNDFYQGYAIRFHPGSSRPDTGNLNKDISALFEKHGIPTPERWIKFMGAWWDAEFFEKRMAELVAKCKESRS